MTARVEWTGVDGSLDLLAEAFRARIAQHNQLLEDEDSKYWAGMDAAEIVEKIRLDMSALLFITGE